jgi:hypothetical protein
MLLGNASAIYSARKRRLVLAPRKRGTLRTNHLSSLAFCILCFLGCADSGPPRAEVSGTVLLDGRPIEEGSIHFIPVQGTRGPGAGEIIRDGKYHIPRKEGVTVGTNRVELRAFKNAGTKIQDPTAPPGVRTEARVQAFPPEFNDRSTVVKEIRAGSNTIDFDVDTKGKGK